MDFVWYASVDLHQVQPLFQDTFGNCLPENLMENLQQHYKDTVIIDMQGDLFIKMCIDRFSLKDLAYIAQCMKTKQPISKQTSVHGTVSRCYELPFSSALEIFNEQMKKGMVYNQEIADIIEQDKQQYHVKRLYKTLYLNPFCKDKALISSLYFKLLQNRIHDEHCNSLYPECNSKQVHVCSDDSNEVIEKYHQEELYHSIINHPDYRQCQLDQEKLIKKALCTLPIVYSNSCKITPDMSYDQINMIVGAATAYSTHIKQLNDRLWLFDKNLYDGKYAMALDIKNMLQAGLHKLRTPQKKHVACMKSINRKTVRHKKF